MEGPGEASLGLLSGSMRVAYTQNPHGSLGSEDRWGEPHLGSRCLRPQSKSVGSLDLYLSSSLGLGVLICGWEAWYHPANLTEMAGQHEMRGWGRDFAPLGAPAPTRVLAVATLHPHLSVRTALGWEPASASWVSTPLAHSQSFTGSGLINLPPLPSML